MARYDKLIIALAGSDSPRAALPLDKCLRKLGIASGSCEIRAPVLNTSDIVTLRERLGMPEKNSSYEAIVPTLPTLEAYALAALANESVHVAIAFEWTHPTLVATKSQFQTTALLVEAIGMRSWDPMRANLHGWASSYSERFRSDAHPEQFERGIATTLKGVVKDWFRESTQYDGILRKMNIRP